MTHTELLELLERVRQGMTTRDDADRLEAHDADQRNQIEAWREGFMGLTRALVDQANKDIVAAAQLIQEEEEARRK